MRIRFTKHAKEKLGEKHMQFKYDPDSDVLAVKLKNRPFAYAQEAGDFIVHFDANNDPVYVEILNANTFLKSASKIMPGASRMFPPATA